MYYYLRIVLFIHYTFNKKTLLTLEKPPKRYFSGHKGGGGPAGHQGKKTFPWDFFFRGPLSSRGCGGESLEDRQLKNLSALITKLNIHGFISLEALILQSLKY